MVTLLVEADPAFVFCSIWQMENLKTWRIVCPMVFMTVLNG